MNKLNKKQHVQNFASEIYSNEILMLFIIANTYVTMQSIHEESRLFSIYINLIEFDILDDLTIYFVNCISKVDGLFFLFTQREQSNYPRFNYILKNQSGASENLFNLMEMKKVNKLWLCYQWMGFSQVDLIPIIENINNVHSIIKENLMRLKNINQSENPETLAQEVSIIISNIQRVLK